MCPFTRYQRTQRQSWLGWSFAVLKTQVWNLWCARNILRKVATNWICQEMRSLQGELYRMAVRTSNLMIHKVGIISQLWYYFAAVPSIRLVDTIQSQRSKRADKKANKELVKDLLSNYIEPEYESLPEPEPVIEICCDSKEKLIQLQHENSELKLRIQILEIELTVQKRFPRSVPPPLRRILRMY